MVGPHQRLSVVLLVSERYIDDAWLCHWLSSQWDVIMDVRKIIRPYVCIKSMFTGSSYLTPACSLECLFVNAVCSSVSRFGGTFISVLAATMTDFHLARRGEAHKPRMVQLSGSFLDA